MTTTITSTYSAERLAKPQSIARAKRVWIRILLFLAPVLAFTVLPVVLVDPFNVFSEQSRVVSPEVKSYFGLRINSVLWKLSQFDRAPSNNILLGDSQMHRLRAEDIEAIDKGYSYFNLAYGYGTLSEAITTFWHAASLTNLRSVYFQISFMSYTPDQRNRVIGAEEMLHNRGLYIANSDALLASYYELLWRLPGGQIRLEPGRDQKDWDDGLEMVGSKYRNRVYPTAQKEELKRIADYCMKNHIRLIFLILPQHIDSQRLIEKTGVTDKYARFKADLSSIAPTVDCDIASPFTTDRSNYSDAFHMVEGSAKVLVDDIWMGKFKLCRELGR